MREGNGNLYCIVADPALARNAVPDTGCYSPKELANKEQVSTTSVYTWIKDGLPVMRQGKLGNIRIYYQDYIQWMIDCAMESEPHTKDIPSWAFRFVKSTTPKSGQNQSSLSQKKEKRAGCDNDGQKNPQKVALKAETSETGTDGTPIPENASKTTETRLYDVAVIPGVLGFAV